jgi:hypothetical protein
MSVTPSEVLTLGGLLHRAETRKLGLPTDTKQCLLHPPNDAVHKGLDPLHKPTLRAFEIVQELLGRQHPNWVRSPRSIDVHRPQRMDIAILKNLADEI